MKGCYPYAKMSYKQSWNIYILLPAPTYIYKTKITGTALWFFLKISIHELLPYSLFSSLVAITHQWSGPFLFQLFPSRSQFSEALITRHLAAYSWKPNLKQRSTIIVEANKMGQPQLNNGLTNNIYMNQWNNKHTAIEPSIHMKQTKYKNLYKRVQEISPSRPE